MNNLTTSDSVLLRTENLGRSVNGKILVEGATFEVHSGQVLAIVGPSGSGKSSLLRLLNRLDEPTSGTVFLEG
ncbi:MAG TPA: ATP-binding cassette domain-containing protein, partial [Terriglobales bacterium]|nr:ATP-binding cassette domain-containing protein [Terriglobales bacterium]